MMSDDLSDGHELIGPSDGRGFRNFRGQAVVTGARGSGGTALYGTLGGTGS